MNEEQPKNRFGYSMLFLIIFFIIIFLIFKGIFKNETWKGFYYPDSSNLLDYAESPVYSSLEECRNWVNTQVYKYNPDGYGYDYECGKNCRLKENFTSLVCEETVR